MKHWSCEWRGIVIRVDNWTRGLRTGERLLVSGAEVDSNESLLWSRMSAYLAAPVRLDGTGHLIEAVIGQGQGTIRSCCKILVDGDVVGGDPDVTLALPVPADLEKVREEGLASFLLKTGLWRFGVPYAVGAAGISLAITHEPDVVSVAMRWAMAGVLFGIVSRPGEVAMIPDPPGSSEADPYGVTVGRSGAGACGFR